MSRNHARTAEDARKDLAHQGITIAAWARANGFPVRAVQEILRGRYKGKYGVSHDIAVALGLKEGTISEQAQGAA